LQPGGWRFDGAVVVVNAKTVAATTISVTIPTGQNFYVVQIKVETTAVSAITVGASITIGSTGTAANSILATQAFANRRFELFYMRLLKSPLAILQPFSPNCPDGARNRLQNAVF
jgi:hypothetical protein